MQPNAAHTLPHTLRWFIAAQGFSGVDVCTAGMQSWERLQRCFSEDELSDGQAAAIGTFFLLICQPASCGPYIIRLIVFADAQASAAAA